MSHITYWSADATACGHYRCELPAREFRKAGHEVVVSMSLDADAPNYTDVIIGQRIGNPLPSKLWRALYRIPNRRFRMVYELDDDVWALVHEAHNPAAPEWGPRIPDVVRNLLHCDAVTVTCPNLAEVVYRFTGPAGPPIHVIPNTVPAELLEVGDIRLTKEAPPSVFGWSGSSTHDGDWAADGTAREVLGWLARPRFRPWSLSTIGVPPGPLEQASRARPSAEWRRIDGTTNIGDYYALVAATFDVGLAPLARTAFNRAKSDLRLLELAALGIPWIATDYGPYAHDRSEAGPHGGVHVRHQGGWKEGMALLSWDDDLRARLSREGRLWAEARTTDKFLPLWAEAYGLDSGTVRNDA